MPTSVFAAAAACNRRRAYKLNAKESLAYRRAGLIFVDPSRRSRNRMSRIYVIHENDAWVEPLRTAFAESKLPFAEWFIDDGTLDLSEAPPAGVFYNRMSASSHTRGHRYAAELTGGVLAWLESHGRRVINGSRALQLEISKMAQYAALRREGIRVPHTVEAVGRDGIVEAAKSMRGRFI